MEGVYMKKGMEESQVEGEGFINLIYVQFSLFSTNNHLLLSTF